MEKIPTAEEFLMEAGFPGHAKHGLAKKWMIEFAKLHVEAALKEASEKVKAKWVHMKDYSRIYDGIDKDSILNSYPLTNIK
jgi:hypothetical protein